MTIFFFCFLPPFLFWIIPPPPVLASPPQISSSPHSLRGVSPQDEAYYQGPTIPCKDGSKTFLLERLNDDFCDCLDGTDEPGTSACPEGKFYCRNLGRTSLLIFSSRVNDGICDCCDGSDEYDAKVKCSNTCFEAGKGKGKEMEKETEPFKEGIYLRKQGIGLAQQKNEHAEKEFSNLKQEKKPKGMVQNFKDIKLVLLLEMVLVSVLFWWKRHCWKQQAKIRRTRRLPR